MLAKARALSQVGADSDPGGLLSRAEVHRQHPCDGGAEGIFYALIIMTPTVFILCQLINQITFNCGKIR